MQNGILPFFVIFAKGDLRFYSRFLYKFVFLDTVFVKSITVLIIFSI